MKGVLVDTASKNLLDTLQHVKLHSHFLFILNSFYTIAIAHSIIFTKGLITLNGRRLSPTIAVVTVFVTTFIGVGVVQLVNIKIFTTDDIYVS